MDEKKNSDHSDDSQKSSKNKELEQRGNPLQEYRLIPVEDWEENEENSGEIDLIELFKTIWDNRKTIYKFVALGVVLGISFALLSPKEYVSYATLMPEYSSGSEGGASSLIQQYGGLIGLSSGGTYGSGSNAIRVDLYPQIVQSLSFQDNLARHEFYFKDYDTTASLYNYYLEIQSPGVLGYIKKYSIGLPGAIIKAFKNQDETLSSGISNTNEIVELSKREMEVIKALRSRVSSSLDEESGILTVRAKMADAKLAAEVTKYTIEELTKYIVEYRTEKVIKDLDFIEIQLIDAQKRFLSKQLELAEFDDSNQGNLTARAQTERERIQSEFDIIFNVYNTLTQRYEEAKLKVQEETPVFKVLQPVQVPVDDEISGALITIVTIILSGLIAIIWIFVEQIWYKRLVV